MENYQEQGGKLDLEVVQSRTHLAGLPLDAGPIPSLGGGPGLAAMR